MTKTCSTDRGRNGLKTDPSSPWLFVGDVMLTTSGAWLKTPTHVQARDYHRDHAEILARPEARVALNELSLAVDPDLIAQHRQLLAAASEQGVQAA